MSKLAETKQRERQVEYGELQVLDELPGRPQKQSPIQELLGQIKADTEKHGRWVMIAKYANGSAATAAANVERQRKGKDQSISGWAFATRRVDEGANTGLFVSYDPSKIEGTAEERHQRHQAWLNDRKTRAAENKAKREAEGKEGNDSAAKGQTQREQANKPAARKAS